MLERIFKITLLTIAAPVQSPADSLLQTQKSCSLLKINDKVNRQGKRSCGSRALAKM